jgi:hypothetical protein
MTIDEKDQVPVNVVQPHEIEHGECYGSGPSNSQLSAPVKY